MLGAQIAMLKGDLTTTRLLLEQQHVIRAELADSNGPRFGRLRLTVPMILAYCRDLYTLAVYAKNVEEFTRDAHEVGHEQRICSPNKLQSESTSSNNHTHKADRVVEWKLDQRRNTRHETVDDILQRAHGVRILDVIGRGHTLTFNDSHPVNRLDDGKYNMPRQQACFQRLEMPTIKTRGTMNFGNEISSQQLRGLKPLNLQAANAIMQTISTTSGTKKQPGRLKANRIHQAAVAWAGTLLQCDVHGKLEAVAVLEKLRLGIPLFPDAGVPGSLNSKWVHQCIAQRRLGWKQLEHWLSGVASRNSFHRCWNAYVQAEFIRMSWPWLWKAGFLRAADTRPSSPKKSCEAHLSTAQNPHRAYESMPMKVPSQSSADSRLDAAFANQGVRFDHFALHFER